MVANKGAARIAAIAVAMLTLAGPATASGDGAVQADSEPMEALGAGTVMNSVAMATEEMQMMLSEVMMMQGMDTGERMTLLMDTSDSLERSVKLLGMLEETLNTEALAMDDAARAACEAGMIEDVMHHADETGGSAEDAMRTCMQMNGLTRVRKALASGIAMMMLAETKAMSMKLGSKMPLAHATPAQSATDTGS